VKSLVLLGAAFVALIGGAWLIGMWMVGVAVMVEAVAVAVFAVLWDDGTDDGDGSDSPLERYRRQR
jgi:predicted PurR-regulated permease PerM